MKNVLVDIYLAYNLGDDMFLEVLAKRFPETRFTIFHPGDNYAPFFSSYHNLEKLPYSIKDKILRKINVYNYLNDHKKFAEKYDALLFLGGGIFREESYEEELFQTRSSLVAEFNNKNKPVFFTGCSFGPYTNESFRKKHEVLFSQCADVCFRDLYSYNLFSNVEQVRYAPDLIWGYEVPEKNTNNDKNLGISVIDPRHKSGLEGFYKEYVDSHKDLIKKYIAKGYKISLFSYCEPEGDLAVINQIISGFSEELQENITVYNYTGNIHKYLQMMCLSTRFVAARFHANIIAMLMEIPTLPVIYSNKTLNMLEDINFGNSSVDIKDLKQLTKYYFMNYELPELTEVAVKSKAHFNKLEIFLGK